MRMLNYLELFLYSATLLKTVRIGFTPSPQRMLSMLAKMLKIMDDP